MSSKSMISFEIDSKFFRINGKETWIGSGEGRRIIERLINNKENDFEETQMNTYYIEQVISEKVYYFEKKYVELLIRDIKEELRRHMKKYNEELEIYQERISQISKANLSNVSESYHIVTGNGDIYRRYTTIEKEKKVLKRLEKTLGIKSLIEF
jgi:hypothetical protein